MLIAKRHRSPRTQHRHLPSLCFQVDFPPFQIRPSNVVDSRFLENTPDAATVSQRQRESKCFVPRVVNAVVGELPARQLPVLGAGVLLFADCVGVHVPEPGEELLVDQGVAPVILACCGSAFWVCVAEVVGKRCG